jgi:hypothetical protein
MLPIPEVPPQWHNKTGMAARRRKESERKRIMMIWLRKNLEKRSLISKQYCDTIQRYFFTLVE